MTSRPDVLTSREWEIASLVADARTDKDIAAELGLTIGTIRFRLSRIYHKLGLTDRNCRVALANVVNAWRWKHDPSGLFSVARGLDRNG